MHSSERRRSRSFDTDRYAVTRTVTEYRWLAPAVLAARERQVACRLDNSVAHGLPRRAGALATNRQRLGNLLLRLGNRLVGTVPIDCASGAP